jgi:3-methyladenine DNA glycosylase AlkD
MPHSSKTRVARECVQPEAEIPRRSILTAAKRAERALAARSRPAGDFDASRYFRGTPDLGFYNVGTPIVRQMAKSLVVEHPEWMLRDAMIFADRLIESRYLESKALACFVVARYQRDFSPPLLARWKGWLARGNAANWATTDAICGCLIGPLLIRHRSLTPRVAAWAGDRNLWVRRASAVGLIPLLRRGRELDAAYRVARRLQDDREDLIQKAVGWMLREAGKADVPRLERYLRRGGAHIPRTTLRYAIERFPPSRRTALLAATKGASSRGQRYLAARRFSKKRI